jgi:hypothetical protein
MRWVAVLLAGLVVGCGPASGIQPGVPQDTKPTPVNPTPDMGPTPKGTKSPMTSLPGPADRALG